MVLNSNRKNVAKIVAAASSSALFLCAPTYQLNGVEGDFPAVENLRDALKSNLDLKTVKTLIATPMNTAIALKNKVVDVANWLGGAPPVFSCDSLNEPEPMLDHLHCLLMFRGDLAEYKDLKPQHRNVYIKEFLNQAKLERLDDASLRQATLWSIRRLGGPVVDAMLTALPRRVAFPLRIAGLQSFLLNGGRRNRYATHFKPEHRQQVIQLLEKMESGSLDSVLLHVLEQIRLYSTTREGVPGRYDGNLKAVLEKAPREDAVLGSLIVILAEEYYLVNVSSPQKLRMLKAIRDVYGN